MNVFLTGATGFVGTALLQRFVADGVEVAALMRRRSDALPVEVVQVVGDLEGIGGRAQLVRDSGSALLRADFVASSAPQNDIASALIGCGVVVHAAARAHIMRDEVANPLVEYRKVNRDATLALARLAAEAGIRRFVFVSSVKVNGEGTFSPSPQPYPIKGEGVEIFTSDDKFVPTDPYGLSKYEAEQGLLDIAQETGMEVVIVRPPLVYGPNAKGNFATMVNWVRKAVPLPLGAVHNARSLVALDNLVDFIALCADPTRSPKAANEIFLISDGVDVSTTKLLRKVAKACGVKSRLLPVPVGLMTFAARLLGNGAVADRLFGNLQVDSSKARDLLGWKPVVTMDEALERMFNS